MTQPPPPPTTGFLVIRSNVSGDQVYIEGRHVGRSGTQQHEQPLGRRCIEVKKEGYEPWTGCGEVLPGEVTTLRARLVALAPTWRGGEMVKVPAGFFWYGCNEKVDSECDNDEKPGRQSSLDEFWIDETEVTVSAYRECVNAGACTDPDLDGNWRDSGRENHPVNSVDWYQAKAFCQWADKRLPTEQEWEKAARGTDGRKHPWGNRSASCSYAVIADGGNGCGRDGTWSVGSKPGGASPYGALDMAGNVWEWTSSSYDSNRRVLRGGSWLNEPRNARASFRNRRAPHYRSGSSGFRCTQ